MINKNIEYIIIYFKIIFNQLGNLLKNKNKEILLLTEVLPGVSITSLFSAMLTRTLVHRPNVRVFIVISDPTINGAPMIINSAISVVLVLGLEKWIPAPE